MGRGFKAVDGIPAQSTFQQSESRDATGLFQLSQTDTPHRSRQQFCSGVLERAGARRRMHSASAFPLCHPAPFGYVG